jgi:predicted nucleotide-binding protein (sugar kinase/HSP70/actin superfamily)
MDRESNSKVPKWVEALKKGTLVGVMFGLHRCDRGLEAGRRPLQGKKCYVPAMGQGTTEAVCACFRRMGLDAEPTPESNERTRELGRRYNDSDACYPAVVMTGDFVRITERLGFEPSQSVFFMPSAEGPCRLGQYSVALGSALQERGFGAVQILSPSDRNGFADLDGLGKGLCRLMWRAMVAADLLHAALLRTRPYETVAGAAERAFGESLDDLCVTIREACSEVGCQLRGLEAAMRRASTRFHAIPVRREERLRIGLVGEVFCRLNVYANAGLARELERQGAEVWLSGAIELLDYGNEVEFQALRLAGRAWSGQMGMARLRAAAQRADQRALARPFGEYQEPETSELLTLAKPYLPGNSVVGEMVVSVGKAAWLARHGAAGVIDVSPFMCMNGIVSEAIYPRLSRDHGGIPIRSLYFDGTHADVETDVGAFLEVARGYRARCNCGLDVDERRKSCNGRG